MFYPQASRDYKDELNWNVTKDVTRTGIHGQKINEADEVKRIKLTIQ